MQREFNAWVEGVLKDKNLDPVSTEGTIGDIRFTAVKKAPVVDDRFVDTYENPAMLRIEIRLTVGNTWSTVYNGMLPLSNFITNMPDTALEGIKVRILQYIQERTN